MRGAKPGNHLNYCNAYFPWQMLASVASVTTRIIAKKLEREQKKKWKGLGEGRFVHRIEHHVCFLQTKRYC